MSTDGRVTVEFKDGCSVPLSGGQHMVVDTKLSCGQQQAAVQQMFKPYRVAQPGAPVGGGTGGGAGGGLGGGALTGAAIVGGLAVGFSLIENNDEVTSPR
ncbi:hypothetical protein [Piscinibacter sakaiensis]|uniref:hypothetical protein n=1 Tax=Piscinibacter sakaiensis TaxID=1547922 RepID=UPI003AAB2AEF